MSMSFPPKPTKNTHWKEKKKKKVLNNKAVFLIFTIYCFSIIILVWCVNFNWNGKWFNVSPKYFELTILYPSLTATDKQLNREEKQETCLGLGLGLGWRSAQLQVFSTSSMSRLRRPFHRSSATRRSGSSL